MRRVFSFDERAEARFYNSNDSVVIWSTTFFIVLYDKTYTQRQFNDNDNFH